MIYFRTIFICINLLVLITYCVFAQQVSQPQYIRLSGNLKKKIENSSYRDFNTVYSNSIKLISLARANDNVCDELYAIYNICWNSSSEREFDTLKTYLSIGQELMHKEKAQLETLDLDGLHRSSMILSLGDYYYTLGNYPEAIRLFTGIVNPGAKPLTGDSDLICSSANYLGQSYYNLGSFDKSIQYFDLGRKYIKKNNQDPHYAYMEALNYSYYSEILFAIENNEEALKYLNKAFQLLISLENHPSQRNLIASDYILLSEYYRRKKEMNPAIHYLYKTLNTYKNETDFAGVYQSMADLYYGYGLHDSALIYYQKSLQLNNRIYTDNHISKSNNFTGIGNIYRDKGALKEARECYEIGLSAFIIKDSINKSGKYSLSNISGILHPEKAMSILLQQARLFYKWFLKDSLQAFLDTCNFNLENGLFLNDLSRRQLIDIKTKEAKSDIRSQITSLGVEASSKGYEITGENKYLVKAFEYIEESKGNILIDKLNDLAARNFAGIPGKVLEEENILRNELGEIKNKLSGSVNDSLKYEELLIAYYDKLRQYNLFITKLEHDYPRFHQLKYNPKSVMLRQIQQVLPPKTLMIQYSIGDDRIYAAGVTRRKVVIEVIDKNSVLMRNLELLQNQLANPGISEIAEDGSILKEFAVASSYLYNKILDPVLHQLKTHINHLIIIPEGVLCYIPFEILLTEKYEGALDYGELPYLIKKYSISYDYSASLWKESQMQEFKQKSIYIAYAPGEYANSQALSASENEVSECCRLWKGRCFTGRNATESSFKSESLSGSIIQLATHTDLNDREPQRSHFTFARDTNSTEDGLLYTYELYNMNIPAKLAILSSCATGAGYIKKGEGIISLARAFKYAGCHNIVMSLWKVNDKTTCDIMIAFNKYLKKGMNKAAALQKAKLDFLNSSTYGHPAYWSSFVLIGSDHPVKNNILLFLFSPLIVLAILLILGRRTLRRIF